MINEEHLYTNDFIMAGCSAIPSAANILKIITIYSGLYTDIASTYYNDKEMFEIIIGEYINQYIKKMYHTMLIQKF